MTLDRIQQGQPGNLTLRLVTPAGAPTDPTPDSATVRVVRDDGTEVIPSVAANDSGTGVFSVPYTAAQAALLDRWTAYWTITVNGQPRVDTTVHEVVGGFLFAISEVRRMSKALQNETTYPESEVTGMRTTVEEAIENELGFALVPRYSRVTLTGDGSTLLRLGPYLRRIRWASVSTAGVTTALTASDVAGLSLSSAGFVTGGYRWAPNSLVTVGYEHGLDLPPEPLRMAARILAKVWLTSGPIDDRTNTFTSTEGGTFSLVTPGRGGSVFGVPSVDAIVDSNRLINIA